MNLMTPVDAVLLFLFVVFWAVLILTPSRKIPNDTHSNDTPTDEEKEQLTFYTNCPRCGKTVVLIRPDMGKYILCFECLYCGMCATIQISDPEEFDKLVNSHEFWRKGEEK